MGLSRGRGGSVQRLALSGVDGHQGLYRCRVPDDLLFDEDHEDDDDRLAVRIVEERPPLREGKVYLDYGERATISENLEAAYVALNQAFRGIWIEKALEYGHVREYGLIRPIPRSLRRSCSIYGRHADVTGD